MKVPFLSNKALAFLATINTYGLFVTNADRISWWIALWFLTIGTIAGIRIYKTPDKL